MRIHSSKLARTIVLAIVLALAAVVLCICGCDESGEDYASSEYGDSFGPLGSASELEGTTVVLSVFADEGGRSWDMGSSKDAKTAQDMLNYLGIATDWISENASKYGCNANFVYDWSNDDNLVMTCSTDYDLTNEEESNEFSAAYIEENVDSNALLEAYDATNIVYMFFLNTKNSLKLTSCTSNYYEGIEYPYEICYIYSHCDGAEENPSSIAHEILHTFGAPDLYSADTDGSNYGVSQDFVDQCDANYLDDVMYDTFDPDTGDPVYDGINNAFTEIDAYYVGITDSSEMAEEWGFDESQHD